MSNAIAKLLNSISFNLISSKIRYYWKFAIALLMSIALAISLNPFVANALNLSDLLRILPSAVQIIQLSSIGDNEEVALGRQIDAQIRREVRISRDRSANALVKRLGQILVPTSDRPNIPYTFQVVDDNNLNAFATMGGFVYINTGTIAAADNVAQLASVVGHEIGHITGRHALEQMKQTAIAQGIANIAGVADDRLVGIGVNLALRLPKSDFLLKIVRRIKEPLVSTSFNLSGEPVINKVNNLNFGQGTTEKPDLIIDGGVLNNKASRLIDLRNDKIVILRK
jgi:tRNA A37 threonylcarbamoyladenosine synthetase subunit TsaC/SUA5/YrdC